MLGIFGAAIATTAAAGGIIGGLLLSRAPRAERWRLATAILVMLPMSALAFHLVRTPYDAWLAANIGG
ncbi:MAG: hypothetical protein U0939_20200 [Pirellulales bacterium]